MDKIIGLGRLGCSVAEEFSAYPEYRIYKINTETDERGSLSLDVSSTIDEYERGIDQQEVEVYLRSVKSSDEVLFIVEGGDPISGATLRILETIKDSSVTIMYLCPDRQMISDIQKRDDRIVFGVLQEYARSGAVEGIILVSTPTVEYLVGEVTIDQYEKSISYFISYVAAMTNYFNHVPAVLSTKISPPDISRIRTLGVSSLEDGKKDINLMFPISEANDIHFFYGVPKKDLEEDASLIKRIKEHVKSYKTEDVSTSFSVYETTLDSLIVLCCAYSPKIQGFAS